MTCEQACGRPWALRAFALVAGMLLGMLMVGSNAPGAADPFDAMNAQRAARPVPVPAFTLQTLEGKSVALGDLKGKVVFFYFWRTW